MKTSILFTLLAALPLTAQAEERKYTCERFQSNCTGESCYPLIGALQKDTTRKIFTVKRTEVVQYVITDSGVTERLRGEQAVYSRERQPVVQYKFIFDEDGKSVFLNKDRKGNVNARVEIQPTSGFYLNFMIHTDGSIKEVPIGTPYLAYFGWCAIGDEPPAPIPLSPSEVPESVTAPAPSAKPVAPAMAPSSSPAATTPPVKP